MLDHLEAPEGFADTLLFGTPLTPLARIVESTRNDDVPRSWGGWIAQQDLPALTRTLQGFESAFLRPGPDAVAALAPAFDGAVDLSTLCDYLRTAYEGALAMLQAGERTGRALRLILD